MMKQLERLPKRYGIDKMTRFIESEDESGMNEAIHVGTEAICHPPRECTITNSLYSQ